MRGWNLIRINTWVNRTIKPLTDIEHWGVVDRWSYPDDGYADCEDYVLLKRRMLMQSGWPRETLLVTVVRSDKDEGHAVLTVTTDKGDYILDNQAERLGIYPIIRVTRARCPAIL
jgi:predicted transglutaminase-like cysteine proteinase